MAFILKLESLVAQGKYPHSHLDVVKSFLQAMEAYQTNPVTEIVHPSIDRETEDEEKVAYVNISWYNAGVTIEISKKRIVLYLTMIRPNLSTPIPPYYLDIRDPQVVPIVKNLATSWAKSQTLRDVFFDDDSDDE